VSSLRRISLHSTSLPLMTSLTSEQTINKISLYISTHYNCRLQGPLSVARSHRKRAQPYAHNDTLNWHEYALLLSSARNQLTLDQKRPLLPTTDNSLLAMARALALIGRCGLLACSVRGSSSMLCAGRLAGTRTAATLPDLTKEEKERINGLFREVS
jgi:hypothetical protein